MSTPLLVWCCGKIFWAHFGLHHRWTPQLTSVSLLQGNTEAVHSTVTGRSPTAAEREIHGCCVMMSSCQHGAKSLRNVSSTSTSKAYLIKWLWVYTDIHGGQKWKHKPWMTGGVAGGALWLHHWCGRVTPVDKRWSFTASAFRLQERKEAGVSVNASSVICTDTAAPHRHTEYNQCSERPIRILNSTLGFSVINHRQGRRTRP